MRTKCYNVYKFEELSEKAKEKALDACRYYQVDHGWWESTYEDAERVGIKITAFDDRKCEGEFISDALETAHKIETEHGDQCETYKTAKKYLADRDTVIDSAPKDENGDWEDERELDGKLDDLDKDFLRSILEDYRITLRNEEEYLTSDESVKEMIDANGYEFNENGGRE